MKILWLLVYSFLTIGSAYAQSNQVPCNGKDVNNWDGCFGTLNYQKGDNYIGEFIRGKENGLGTYTYADGAKYVGSWKDGKRDGLGSFFAPNGAAITQGVWANNAFIRSELVQQAVVINALSQQATSINNKDKHSTLPACQGSDILKWTNCFGIESPFKNDKYLGEFKDGRWNGNGTYIFADGRQYVGEWRNYRYNGLGIEYDKNGIVITSGMYRDGNLGYRLSPDKKTFPFYAPATNLVNIQPPQLNNEIEILRAEADEAKRKQAEAEEKMRVAQQQASQTIQTSPVTTQSTITIGKRVALVVGNSNYKVRPLKNSRNDADDMSRSLRTSGFEVIDLRDATLPQMRTAVRQFGDKLLTYDVGLVYYSGHGVEVKGRNYFIPVNADIMREDEIADQGLDVSLILEKMNTAQKSVNILIVDACRDDPFGRSFRSTSRGLAQMDAPRGTIIAYATSPGKVASDGDARERNSPYTKHLLRAMQSPNKPIEQVFKEVRRAVQDETKNQQTPWENTSLSGDFYFKVAR